MWICIAFLALGAVALTFYLLEKCRRYSLRGVIIKGVVSLLFVSVAAVCAYFRPGHILVPMVIVGLSLGLSGDLWLDLKYVYPKFGSIYTYAGFAVFGFGHIYYVLGMFFEYGRGIHPLYIIIPLLLASLISVGNLFLAKPMKLDYGKMKWVVAAYGFALFCLPLSSLSLCIYTSFQVPTLIMLFIGGILFAVSDLVLSGTYFGKGHEKPIDFILNYLTYYPAQFLIAFSLFFL